MLYRFKHKNNHLEALFNELHVIQNLTILNRQHFQIYNCGLIIKSKFSYYQYVVSAL